MSTIRLPSIMQANRSNNSEIETQNGGEVLKAKDQPNSSSISKKENIKVFESSSFGERQTTDIDDKSMLTALDDLSDDELDELLDRTLALNKRLKDRLKEEDLQGNDCEKTANVLRSRNTVVLPPIVKKDSAMSTRLRTNR